MTIEVWARKRSRRYQEVSYGLHVFLREGRAFASWTPHPLGAGKSIPVSDELAYSALGAIRVACPHVDELPVKGIWKPGYRCYDKPSGDDCNTVEHCKVCGYFTFYSGSTGCRAIFTGQHSDGVGHPYTTYLAAERQSATVDAASWEDDRLSVPSDATTLIIWVRSIWHLRKDGAERAATRAFPDAEVVLSGYRYLILRQPAHTLAQA